MNLSDTPDDSLRYAAERGLAERLERARSDYAAAQDALTAARERARIQVGALDALVAPPWYVLDAWAARDAAWDALCAIEDDTGVNEELSELAAAREALDWGRA